MHLSWFSDQSTEVVRMFTVMAMNILKDCGLGVYPSASTVSAYVGTHERTIKKWVHDFYGSGGEILSEKRGYSTHRPRLADDDDIKKKVMKYLRECTSKNHPTFQWKCL